MHQAGEGESPPDLHALLAHFDHAKLLQRGHDDALAVFQGRLEILRGHAVIGGDVDQHALGLASVREASRSGSESDQHPISNTVEYSHRLYRTDLDPCEACT